MKATGDVRERRRWRMQRAIRSGRGRNAPSDREISAFQAPQQEIVRRIDDLGRVVIPKEIRRTMRIREEEPLIGT